MVSPFRQRFASPAFPASHPVPAIERATLTGGGLMANKPWHSDPLFVKTGRAARAAANANPSTRCPTCGRTMAEIRQTKPKAVWHWDHVLPGSTAAGFRIRCSPCNARDGALMTNAKRASGYDW